MLQHIALEIRVKDLQDFYIGILGGTIENRTILKEKDTSDIFQINKEVTVYFLKIENITLELFIHDAVDQESLQHFCIAHNDALKIYQKAKERKYWTFLREKEYGSTYFIRDNNGNMFEIKNKELQ
jgi:hypothetical protein